MVDTDWGLRRPAAPVFPDAGLGCGGLKWAGQGIRQPAAAKSAARSWRTSAKLYANGESAGAGDDDGALRDEQEVCETGRSGAV